MEGKKLRKRGKEGKFQKSEEKKRENIEAIYERLKRLLQSSDFNHMVYFERIEEFSRVSWSIRVQRVKMPTATILSQRSTASDCSIVLDKLPVFVCFDIKHCFCEFVPVSSYLKWKIARITQCGNFIMFLSHTFYVKSILRILEVQNQPFQHI